MCRVCNQTKPLDAFTRGSSSRNGRTSVCKACSAEKARLWRQANRERARANARARYLANWDAAIERSQARYWKDPASFKAYAREHRKAYDVGEVHERRLVKARERYHANLEYETARSKRYYEANRKKWRSYRNTRRAREGDPTRDIQDCVIDLLVKTCAYCGAIDNIEIDHVIPLARDGTHTVDNLAPACRACNRSKGAKLLSEWKH